MKQVIDELGRFAGKLDLLIVEAERDLSLIDWWRSPQGVRLMTCVSGLKGLRIYIDSLRKSFRDVQEELRCTLP